MAARLMTEVELSKMLNVKPATIRQWRARGMGPPYIRITNRLIRYDRFEVESWIERVDPIQPPEDGRVNEFGGPTMRKMQMKRTRSNLGNIED